MAPLILLAVLVLGPALAAVVLRVNAAILFMSLCVGELLVQYAANDTVNILTSASTRANNISQSTIELGLLLVPVALTSLFTFHSLKGTKAIINILPALGFGVTGALLIEPLLSHGFQKTLTHASAWHQILQARSFVVSISAAAALMFLWFGNRSSSHTKHGHKAKQH